MTRQTSSFKVSVACANGRGCPGNTAAHGYGIGKRAGIVSWQRWVAGLCVQPCARYSVGGTSRMAADSPPGPPPTIAAFAASSRVFAVPGVIVTCTST